MTNHTASASTSLIKVANWDGRSRDISRELTTAFDAQDYLECIKDLPARGIDPRSYINKLDRIIESLPADPELRKRCIRALRKTCGLYGILPSSYTLVSPLSNPGERQKPFASGGFADVWRLTSEANTSLMFAVKSIRVYEEDPVDKINKKYCKEVIVCKRATHPNILSIEGVEPKLFDYCMVSRWMPNGNLLSYVAKHPGADRLKLLIGVTRGLGYLHENDVVHGDLKNQNILVDETGSPRLSDFGLCSITKNINSVNASTPNRGYTVRYCAPELLEMGEIQKERRKPTIKSDVYSLSMVVVELATGKMPFPEFADPLVTIMISKGKRPLKPHSFDAPGITPGVWKVAKKCWREKAKERPEVNIVLQNLEKIANAGDDRPPSPFRQILRDMFD